MGWSPMQHMSWTGTGMRTVVSGGTPNALTTAAVRCKRVMLLAPSTNSGAIFYGISASLTKTMDAGNITTGAQLAAGDSSVWLIVPDDDLQNIYIDGTTDDDVTFIYEG